MRALTNARNIDKFNNKFSNLDFACKKSYFMRMLARVIVPYSFGIESNVPICFTVDNKKIVMIVEPCEGVHVFSYLSKNLDWLTNLKKRHVIKINIKKGKNESFEIRKIYLNRESEFFLDGNVDLLKSALFDIYFDFQGIVNLEGKKQNNEIGSEKQNNEIRDKAIELLSFFINTYRSITNEPDVHNPAELEFPAIEFYYSKKEYISYKDIYDGEYFHLKQTYSKMPEEATGYLKKMMSSDELKVFYTKLNSKEPVPIYLQLIADAREYALIKKDYKISIILSSCATEMYLQDRLIKECDARRITNLTIGDGKRKKTLNYIEAITIGNIRDELIGDICKYLIGKNLKESIEYKNWFDNAYNLRNNIIHKGKTINTEIEAKRAFESVITLVNYINEQLIKSRPG